VCTAVISAGAVLSLGPPGVTRYVGWTSKHFIEWYTIPSEKLMLSQLKKIFPYFIVPVGLIPCPK
jgi:hypothetical protein